MAKNRFKKALAKAVKGTLQHLHLVVQADKIYTTLPTKELHLVRGTVVYEDPYDPRFYMQLFDKVLAERARLMIGPAIAGNIAIVIPLSARALCYRYLVTCEGFRSINKTDKPGITVADYPDMLPALGTFKKQETDTLYGTPVYFNGPPGRILIYDTVGDGKIATIDVEQKEIKVKSYSQRWLDQPFDPHGEV